MIDIKIQDNSQPNTITFTLTGNTDCGTLSLDENGKMQFEGDVAASAQVFFDFVCGYYNQEQGTKK